MAPTNGHVDVGSSRQLGITIRRTSVLAGWLAVCGQCEKMSRQMKITQYMAHETARPDTREAHVMEVVGFCFAWRDGADLLACGIVWLLIFLVCTKGGEEGADLSFAGHWNGTSGDDLRLSAR